ncbi:Uncharacterized protein OBRU01_26306 [Operophtera brumata]|uniref:FP protein C-terminal domain-containing protein n=1 Tax=Operophtera brumata TaxID=104452 RepID=A0A0L7K438_OPEBR|nr:Uncharacterized protein OBRU01_26306 [Operophtera brumata]
MPLSPHVGTASSLPLHIPSGSQHSESDTDRLSDKSGKITSRRTKRKFEDQDDSKYRTMVADMRMKFSVLASEQNKKLEVLQSTLTEIKERNSEFCKSLDFLALKYEELSGKLERSENDRQDERLYIQSLENKIEQLERQSKGSTVEIRNLTKKSGTESKDDLCDLVKEVGKALKSPIQSFDIYDVYRNNTKGDAIKPITVEFNSVMAKNRFILSFKKFNKDHKPDNLNSKHLHLEGAEKRVFISEALTQKARKLFFLSREFAKENDFNFCWTAYGQIYLRKREGMQHIRVKDAMDLDKLKPKV